MLMKTGEKFKRIKTPWSLKQTAPGSIFQDCISVAANTSELLVDHTTVPTHHLHLYIARKADCDPKVGHMFLPILPRSKRGRQGCVKQKRML